MEEKITRAIKAILEEDLPKYLVKFSNRPPVITLHDFYRVIIGQPRYVDGYPVIYVVSSGWSKTSDDLIYAESQDIIDIYRYIITVCIEGDDPELLEYMGIRYREAIKECFRDNCFLRGTARGCMISSGDNYNNVFGEQAIELSFRLNLDVWGMDQDSTIKVKR